MLFNDAWLELLYGLELWVVKCEFWTQMAATPAERAVWSDERVRTVARLAKAASKVGSQAYEAYKLDRNSEAKTRLAASHGRCHAFVVPPFINTVHQPVSESGYPFGYTHYRQAYQRMSHGQKAKVT